jgi:orotate phosphoribosyltransferase
MTREELSERLSTSAVIRRRLSSPGALVRGWRIESAHVLGDPAAAGAAARLLRTLIADIPTDSIIGIERGGAVLSYGITAEAAENGARLLATTWNIKRNAPASTEQAGLRAIVVDDIVNSGLTMHRAIRGLETLDIEVVAAACLIRYPNHRPIALRTWSRPFLSVFDLRDLQLRRFTYPKPRK